MINAVFSMLPSVVKTNAYLQDTWRLLVLVPSKSNPGSQDWRTTSRRISYRGIWTLPLLGLLVVISSQNVGAQTDTETDRTGNEPTQVPTAGASAVQVVAEGVGTSPDEALKDAFRNAVRQVVGAVVDAETLIKDDQVIDDKVLTYSDGFITRYEEVSGSKKHGSLFHLKIKAVVERKSVVAKLKAANVTVKELDGQGMFAEAVTKLEGQTDAKAIIAKAFADYPVNVIKATITKPSVETIHDEINLVYQIELSVDLAKYEAFQKKIVKFLQTAAKRKGKCLVIGTAAHRKGGQFVLAKRDVPYHGTPPDVWFILNSNENDHFDSAWWTGNLSADDDVILVINTTRTIIYERMLWEWFHVPRSNGAIFNKSLNINVQFQDAQGQDIICDSLRFGTGDDPFREPPYRPERGAKPGLLVAVESKSMGHYGDFHKIPVAYVSPVCFFRHGLWGDGYMRTNTFPRRITTTLDELRRITATKIVVEIQK